MPYKEEIPKEPLILEPEDWTAQEWKAIAKLFNIPANDKEARIVVTISKLETFLSD